MGSLEPAASHHDVSVKCGMGHISGEDAFLSRCFSAAAVDDYVNTVTTTVRSIDAFVDSLDLRGGGVPARSSTWRQGPSGLRSCGSAEALHLRVSQPPGSGSQPSRLEVETHRNLEVDLADAPASAPTSKTIGRLPAKTTGVAHPAGLSGVRCGCAENLALYGRELIAVDGTRIKAVNNSVTATSREPRWRGTCNASTTGWNATSNR